MDALDLQWQTAVSYHMGAENRTQVLRKGSQFS